MGTFDWQSVGVGVAGGLIMFGLIRLYRGDTTLNMDKMKGKHGKGGWMDHHHDKNGGIVMSHEK